MTADTDSRIAVFARSVSDLSFSYAPTVFLYREEFRNLRWNRSEPRARQNNVTI